MRSNQYAYLEGILGDVNAPISLTELSHVVFFFSQNICSIKGNSIDDGGMVLKRNLLVGGLILICKIFIPSVEKLFHK